MVMATVRPGTRAALLRGNTVGRGLLNGLVSYYDGTSLEGVLVKDRVSGLDLSSHAGMSATQAGPGKIATALTYASASSQYADVADTVQQSLTGPQAIFGWMNIASSTAANQTLAAKWTAATNNRSSELYYNVAATTFNYSISPDGTSVGNGAKNWSAVIALAVWHFVVGVYDGSTIGISVDGGAVVTNAYSGGVFDSTASFSHGCIDANGTPSSFANAGICGVGLLNRVVTAAEITHLYNNGLGCGFDIRRGFYH